MSLRDRAVVAGDVAMLGGEVNGVLKAMRSHGLSVASLAAGVKAAVDLLGMK